MSLIMQNPEDRQIIIYRTCHHALKGCLVRISRSNDPKIRRALVGEFFSWIVHALDEQEIIASSIDDFKEILNHNIKDQNDQNHN